MSQKFKNELLHFAQVANKHNVVKVVSPLERNCDVLGKAGKPDYALQVFMAITNAKKNAESEEREIHKVLTKKEKAKIVSEIKAERVALLALPPAPQVNISPAPQLGNLNPVSLCGYVSNKFPKISAIPEFAGCTPTVVSVTDIYTALYPLANMNPKKMSDAELTRRNTLTKQLRTQFLKMVNSCAILADGDLALFQLTDVAVKRTPQKHDGKPATPVFRFDYTKGRGALGVVIDRVPNVKGYTIWFGTGDFDKQTWNWQSGPQRQVIEDQTPGELLNVIVIANGTKKQSDPSNPQGGNVPFN